MWDLDCAWDEKEENYFMMYGYYRISGELKEQEIEMKCKLGRRP